MQDYNICKLSDVIDFNPKEKLSKGSLAKKVSMDKLQPYTKVVSSFDIAKYNGGAKFRNGDTIMARITPCLENGKTSFVDFLDDDEVAFGSTEFVVMRAKEGVTDSQYIYYLATSPEFRKVAIQSMVGSSGRQRVQQGVLNEYEIALPPLEEQKRIAAILSALDDKIEINRKINENLEQQAQALFKSWFVDFEPWGGLQPVQWQEGTINDIGNVIGGSTPSKAKPEYYTDCGIAWITPKDLSINKSKFIAHGEIDITELGLKNSSAKLMPKGTVLFSSRAPIGYIAIAAGEVTTNQGFKSIVPKPEISTAYVYYFLKQNLSLIESMASGSTFKEISGATMKTVPIVIPDLDILAKFNAFCVSIFAQQQLLEEENKSLLVIRHNLLLKLMSGELEVSDIDI